MLIHLVADYGHGDVAFAEVRQRLAQLVPEAEVFVTPVPAFDTVSAGFCAAQLALTDGPADRLVYTNVAPRADQPDPRPGNQGERLVAALPRAGAVVVGVNAQHCFSFLRDEAGDIREVAVPDAGSQFRSRDLFPAVVAALARGDRQCLGGRVSPELLPPPPERAVAYVDGYGNLKTTWSQPPEAVGGQVQVRVGGCCAVATVTDGTFAVRHGEMSFAPGSSGWRRTDGGEVRFYELLLRGGSAARRLGNPGAGTPVDVRPVAEAG
ncbi:MAG: SAM-dependent chlorinase/fluorinase [Actinomycetota bacterium]|nr:SAM-dependent chlorinase/fluorinase [Actinomycetota bacterium]